MPRIIGTFVCLCVVAAAGCRHHRPPGAPMRPLPLPQTVTQRAGHEIVVCGQLYDTGAPVVLWVDPGGYDMYDAGPTTLPATQPSFARRQMRTTLLSDAELDRVRREGWTLPLLRKTVDQFVIHFDECGVSQTCFRVLKQRGLGVQFMLDIDGTIYQTMDLQEQAPHATKANGRSVGVEIANMGAPSGSADRLAQWYHQNPDRRVVITVPEKLKGGGVRTPNFVGGPARTEMVGGVIQGARCRQYDFTPQQYASLIKLTAALCTIFPKIECDYPRQKASLGPATTRPSSIPGAPTTRPGALASPEEPGELIPYALSNEQYNQYQGVLGHYHVQTNKDDPGPAFQWDGMIRGARSLMSSQALEANRLMRGRPVHSFEPPATRPSRGRFGRRPSATTQSATTQAATQP